MTYNPSNEPDPKVFLAKARYFIGAYRNEAMLAAVLLLVAGITFYYALISPIDLSPLFTNSDRGATDARGEPLKMEPTTLYVNELRRRMATTQKQFIDLKGKVGQDWKVDASQPSSTWISSSQPLHELVSAESSAATAWAKVATALVAVPDRLRDAEDALIRWTQRPRGAPKSDLDELKRVLDGIDLQLRSADEAVKHLKMLRQSAKFQQAINK